MLGELRCSFCNKSQRYVKKLIAGPNVQICDECVDICVNILNATPAGPKDVDDVPPPPLYAATFCSLCRMPAPLEHIVPIHGRGALCPGCISAIEAAVAVAREEEE